MKDKTLITLASIGAITILEIYALNQHIDGVMLATVFAVLGGLAGFKLKKAG